ncbi:DUF2157 domain-containing protein [Aliiglaciecola sp. CAU 1673]|uniref:DUF2157 domain-containing protein n=1 Tax=Aliiglaciecola sp. CAU 1673 TaxID=3032595 RepID=UPI0023DA2E25|nr:DUF2157 domain-containing protein [Aliiglaciecola sp. CAU 1673]MDF2179510.1 DUF2157 domain-containing protein [Aliiglaciecola sp. CAU 1673]
MKISKQLLQDAVANSILSQTQADALYGFLQQRQDQTPRFDFTHVLYYLGGMLAIGAMTLFMNLGWETFGGAGIFFISLLYAGIGLKMSQHFEARFLSIPAGICATFVVVLTPLAIYGLQHWLGIWPDDSQYREYHRIVHWHWLYMELGTLAVGATLLWRFRYAFLVMPLAVTLWYLSMDLAALLNGTPVDWELRKLVSMYVGLLMIGLAFWIDIRSRISVDYAFWIYLFGVIAFWCGLSLQHSDSQLSKFIYLCINLVMIGVGVVLVRRVFVIFGAIGAAGYFGQLAWNVFKESWGFPIVLTLIGLGVIYLGVFWQKREQQLSEKARAWLPQALRELLEARH